MPTLAPIESPPFFGGGDGGRFGYGEECLYDAKKLSAMSCWFMRDHCEEASATARILLADVS